MNNEKYKSTIGFTDLLFNILVGFAFLFIIAFILIKPEAKKHDFERSAEFVVVLEWDHDASDDIDLYVQDPTGNRVSFRHRIVNFMHLDKDDLGYVNDIVMNVDGTITKVNINREVVTIRGIIPGEHIINVHYYSTRRSEAALNSMQRERRGDTEIISVDRHGVGKDGKPNKKRILTVKIELHKVNPYEILWIGEKTFDRRGQEETLVRFTINSKGKVVGAFTYEQKKFVVPKFGGMSPSISSRNAEYEGGDRVDGPNGDDVESGTEDSRYRPGGGEFP
ncbi:hypothetical protein HX858_09180 [Marine Group I thaumarchaeote]|uniref:Uncharacterized protein n=1 Tax=Marine Group I thaumarchaeote TaxID=2511932 RepID=A0A7K4MWZ8_9ARCH|nr:hypothetical protein [Marine Group I thaumarchaeote]